MNNPKKFAVLIDADNSSPKKIPAILQEVAKYGIASVKRIYGDWSSERLNAWREILLPHAITPIQQFAYTKGKDATDMILIINAMDLLYGGALDGFCIVSSDSDFTPLASRIRESGLLVYGFGENKTPNAFINACDKFIYIENLENGTDNATQDSPPALPKNAKSADTNTIAPNAAPPQQPQNPLPSHHTANTQSENTNNQAKPIDEATLQLIYKAIKDTADDDGWSNLSSLGNYLTAIKPDFDTRTYGRAKLSGLLALLDVFEIKQEGSQKYVRKRPSFSKFLNIAQKTIKQYRRINEWAYLNPLAIEIKKQHPDFNASEYGCRNIVELLKKIDSKSFEFNQNKTQIRLLPNKETP
ncbi:MAG: NYN domain-containing protein [Moraxella sp.]|nr:NYN domain-containing protein [Moraxella sp.]